MVSRAVSACNWATTSLRCVRRNRSQAMALVAELLAPVPRLSSHSAPADLMPLAYATKYELMEVPLSLSGEFDKVIQSSAATTLDLRQRRSRAQSVYPRQPGMQQT